MTKEMPKMQNTEMPPEKESGAVLNVQKINAIMKFLENEPAENFDRVEDEDVYRKIVDIFGVGDYGERDLAKQLLNNLRELKPTLASDATQKMLILLAKLQTLEMFDSHREQDFVNNLQRKSLANFSGYIYEYIFYQSNTDRETTDFSLLERNLEKIDSNLLILSTLLQLSKNQGAKIGLEQINGISSDVIKGKEFSDTDIEEIKSIYEINYGYTPQFASRLFEGFLSDKEKSSMDFTVMRYQNKIIGILGLEELRTHRVHFGKFNIHPQIQGASVGSAMLKKNLAPVCRENIILAECRASLPISASYLKSGFIAYKSIREDVDEIDSLSIARNDTKNNMFASKKMSKGEIIKAGTKLGELNPVKGSEAVFVYKWKKYTEDVPWSELVGKKDGGKVMVMTWDMYTPPTKSEREDGDKGTHYYVFENVPVDKLGSYLNDFSKSAENSG